MNNIFISTLIGQVICLAVSFILPFLMAKDDAIEIELNGSFDSLQKRWHKVSVETRILIFGSLSTVSLMPAVVDGHIFEALALAFAFGLFSTALHWFVFDRKLNKLRGLDPDYVGKNAETDNYVRRFTASEITRMKHQLICIGAVAYLVSSYFLFIRLFI